jgi:hypothetical protein
MAAFYKGVGIGTYLHTHDPRISGIPPQAPHIGYGLTVAMHHIVYGTTYSPLVSLTRSYGVAEMYARDASLSLTGTAYVFEIHYPDPLPGGITLYDPVKEVASSLPQPSTDLSYFHDGGQDFLLGVAAPHLMPGYLTALVRQPGGGGTPHSPNLTIQLETLVRALRDAEVLVHGTITTDRIITRHSVTV